MPRVEMPLFLTSLWRNAVQQAKTISRGTDSGWVPLGYEREFDESSNSQINWKAQLWRFIVQTPTDFTGFDRRFIGLGL